MDRIIPNSISSGNTIRVVSPSDEISCISTERRTIANRRFESLGVGVTFGIFTLQGGHRKLTIEEKVEDIHNAFLDPKVHAVFSVIGGLNANSLLPYIDWELIRQHPKIWCGYSDIDVLGMALYAKAGLVTYSGPHYSTLSQLTGVEYTIEYIKRSLMSLKQYDVLPSAEWSNDLWYIDQNDRNFFPNPGWSVIQEGVAQGVFIGSNLSSFLLLKGTEYMPNIEGAIIGVEMDGRYGKDTFLEFCRKMDALTHLPSFSKVGGIIIGRFPQKVAFKEEDLRAYFASRDRYRGLPILAGVDFGHTDPQCTFPIGGNIFLEARRGSSALKVLTRTAVSL